MGNALRYMCLLETRRLLLLMGVLFAAILFIQSFELPYSDFLSSLFSAGNSQVAPAGTLATGDSSSDPNASSGLNSTSVDVVHGGSNITEISDDDSNVKDLFESERNKSFEVEIDPEEEFPSNDFLEINSSSTVQSVLNNISIPDKAKESEYYLPVSTYTTESNSSLDHKIGGDIVPALLENEDRNGSQATPPVALSPSVSSSRIISSQTEDVSISTSAISPTSSKSSIGKDAEKMLKNKVKPPQDMVVPIDEMNDMLLQSHASYYAMKPRWSSTADQELLNAKSMIENAPIIRKDPNFDVNLYRNFSAFKRSYELMEQTLKVYIYSEGESPIFHRPTLKGIYASEGWFMKLLKANRRLVTKKPTKAHLFYLPFSSRMLEETLYVPNSHSRDNLVQCLSNYLDRISTKYHFWNRTGGADHFLVACHDWAPAETKEIMANCIRSLCNADIKEGFVFGKDASLPETAVQSPQNPLRKLGGKPPSQRQILAFFAGGMHGYLRPVLLNYWENKDPDMKIFGKIRKVKGQMSYVQYMKSSKYCICARGYEVNSPRVVEAIFYECVPVIISDNFVPPFFETLNWEAFAVFILEKDIPNLKNILLSIPKKRYLEMQQRVKQVQQHFLWHPKPVKYDIFHMILHSIWYTRVFQMR